MRPLEIVIPILLAVYLLWPHPQPIIIRLAPAAALIIDLVHFTLERYRWQMLSPTAPQLGLKGPLNGKRATKIVDAYLLDFFEMTLNNKPSALFGGSFNVFSEVKVRH